MRITSTAPRVAAAACWRGRAPNPASPNPGPPAPPIANRPGALLPPPWAPPPGPAQTPATPRVATRFAGIAREFLRGRGVDAGVVPLSGAAEVAPHLGIADVVLVLTSTG